MSDPYTYTSGSAAIANAIQRARQERSEAFYRNLSWLIRPIGILFGRRERQVASASCVENCTA